MAAKKKPKPSTNGKNGRKDNGQFAKGNAGGPGNPHAKKVAALRTALYDAVTQADVDAVVARMVEQAKAGDAAARKELFDRVFGKAAQPLEVGGLDGEPLKININVCEYGGNKS